MDRRGLPGIDELFREQDRLAKKLSQEELNALRRYLQKAVHTECESVVARMRFLQAAHDVNESQFQHALVTLQRDLERKHTIAAEFRREFGSLAKVFQARELRYQDRHDTLVREVRRCREAVKEAVQAREKAEEELAQKEKDLVKNMDMVVDLEDQLALHKDCDRMQQDLVDLGKNLLKIKLENERLRKELGQATAKLERGGRTFPTTRLQSDKPQNHVRFAPSVPSPKHNTMTFTPSGYTYKNTLAANTITPSVLPPKNNPVTFTPVTPYCTSNTCRARQDLEDCRALFIKKCEELAHLHYALAERKKSREQMMYPVARGTVADGSKPSATVQPLKPAGYQREKGGSLSHGRAAAAPSKSFKLGPALPAALGKL